jgi:ATP-dependent protease ClpP protease subunit
MNRFWKFSNSADGDSAELLLYGPISDEAFWGDELTPKMFADDLAALGDINELTVRINSQGGSVFAAAAMYNTLKTHKAKVTAYIDGIAASAASVVAMAGDTVIMPQLAVMMIHNPEAGVRGDSRKMQTVREILDKIRDTTIIPAYAAKTGMDTSELRAMLDAGSENSGTWLSAEEAVEKGFADKIDMQNTVSASINGKFLVVNGLSMELDRFKTIPAAFAATDTVIPPATGDDINLAAQAASKNTEVLMSTPKDPNVVDPPVVDPVDAGGAQPPADPGAAQAAAAPAPDPDPVPAANAAPDPVEDPIENAVTAERVRIRAILGLSQPGLEKIINAAIDEGLTVEVASHRILTSDDFKASQALAARQADAGAVNGVAPGGAATDEPLSDEVIANMDPKTLARRMPEIKAYYEAQRK